MESDLVHNKKIGTEKPVYRRQEETRNQREILSSRPDLLEVLGRSRRSHLKVELYSSDLLTPLFA